MLVLTADQRSSRLRDDLVPAALEAVTDAVGDRLSLAADRNAGDEIQLATSDGAAALEAALSLVRTGDWAVGLGAGGIDVPLPASVREARGAAFIHARSAVERAKRAPSRLAIDGDDAELAAAAEAFTRLLIDLRDRRSEAGWEVADALAEGLTQKDVAARLGISAAAVSTRAKAAGLRVEEAAVPHLARLLDRLAAG